MKMDRAGASSSHRHAATNMVDGCGIHLRAWAKREQPAAKKPVLVKCESKPDPEMMEDLRQGLGRGVCVEWRP